MTLENGGFSSLCPASFLQGNDSIYYQRILYIMYDMFILLYICISLHATMHFIDPWLPSRNDHNTIHFIEPCLPNDFEPIFFVAALYMAKDLIQEELPFKMGAFAAAMAL